MKLIDSLTTAISSIKNPGKRDTIRIARSLAGKKGIEIGGPSDFFKGKTHFPVYLFAATVDGVNFSDNTVWEGTITAGQTYRYYKGAKKGHQFVAEGTELNDVPANAYDFLLSSHSLEHIANPIKALKRWHDVLKKGGILALSLPNKNVTFDVNRPYTTFEHLMEDYCRQIGEDDNTHFEEVVGLYEEKNDPNFTNKDDLRKRTFDNFLNRCVHHHVFSFDLIQKMLDYCGFDVIVQKEVHKIHLFTIAKKR